MTECGCGQGERRGSRCGHAGVSGGVRDGAFSRPTFFDGQLLCADDLAALATYTRGKDRLHNRHLLGAGVVCGLEVFCSTADPGSVSVRTGYALDCCGNDIVVPCDQTVDINELVAALPHEGGCVEPCPPPAIGNGEAQGANDRATAHDGRRYALVLEYSETPTDLVAPYASDDDRVRPCEPTRMAEGFRFGLRCASCSRHGTTGADDALDCCREAWSRLRELRRLGEVAEAHASTVAAEDDIDGIDAAVLDSTTATLAADPDLPTAVKVVGMAVRAIAANDAAEAREALDAVADALSTIHDDAPVADALRSAEITALGRHVERLRTRLDEPELTREDRLLAHGVVSGPEVDTTLHSQISGIRDWVVHWLTQRPSTMCDCSARSVPQVPAAARAEELGDVVDRLDRALQGIVRDCLCGTLNPPCTPCDDVAVTLALVTVRNCEVVEICNQARRHVVTGAALRYWLNVDAFEQWVQDQCCNGRDVTDLAKGASLGLPGMLATHAPSIDAAAELEQLREQVRELEESIAGLRDG